MNILQIFTDGASNVHNEKQPGGWAFAYVYSGMLLYNEYEGEAPTTNQRMEMMGAIKGLENLDKISSFKDIEYNTVEVITDSAYVYRCMVEMWYVTWRFNNWLKVDDTGKVVEIKNRDLWERLIKISQELKEKHIIINWTKIRGHRGIVFNEVVDKLAKKAKISVS